MSKMLWKIRIFFKICFIRLFSKKTYLINDEVYNSALFYIIFGRKGDFRCPKTFNEHIIHNKLYSNEEGYEKYTDKYEVREYVFQKTGDTYLNEVIGIYQNPTQIPFDQLPNAFALKGTHGSGYNIIVKDKTKINQRKIIARFKKWMKQNYYYQSREKNYKNIRPRIVCERYLQSLSDKSLNEVKLWCFNGAVRIIADTRVIGGKRKINLYDQSKELLKVRMGSDNHTMELPSTIDEMIRVAELLSADFDFVRVDLYNVDEKIVFSELTFHPGGGLVPFEPEIWDSRIGLLFGE